MQPAGQHRAAAKHRGKTKATRSMRQSRPRSKKLVAPRTTSAAHPSSDAEFGEAIAESKEAEPQTSGEWEVELPDEGRARGRNTMPRGATIHRSERGLWFSLTTLPRFRKSRGGDVKGTVTNSH